MGKRNIFAELIEGVGAMKEHREGKLVLRMHKLPVPVHAKDDVLPPQSYENKITSRRLG
jgi:hypothetical protein